MTDYLIDPYNHTGYAQVLAETTGSTVTYYTIGDDVLAQTVDGTTQYLLYDGHGSTRQLVASDGSTIVDSYSYDAYGVMLGGNPQASTDTATNLLYSGEQFDTSAQQYYLRARYYNQNNGTFNRVDPYAGNTSDPQSLHKYAYVHNNPVNNIDPSGLISIVGTMLSAAIRSALTSLIISVPFRALEAAASLASGADVKSVMLNMFIGIAEDALIGAVLGGVTTGLVSALGSNALKIRAVGQSLTKFKSLRLPNSVWRLDKFARGLKIESKILNRAAGFIGRQIRNFPVIDDYVMKGGKGIATSIKSLDLTADTYQTASNLTARLKTYANALSQFSSRTWGGVTIGGTQNPISQKILVVAFENGAANSAQANALVTFARDFATKYPDLKLVFQFI